MMKKHLGFSTTSAFTAMVFACSGCSFLFTTKAPSQPERLPPNERIECTSSKAAPVIDTIVGGLEVVRTGVALGADDSDYRNVAISREADIALGVAFSALFISSAAYGYTVTSRCSALKEDRLERLRTQPVSGPGYAVPPGGYAPSGYPPGAYAPPPAAYPPPPNAYPPAAYPPTAVTSPPAPPPAASAPGQPAPPAQAYGQPPSSVQPSAPAIVPPPAGSATPAGAQR